MITRTEKSKKSKKSTSKKGTFKISPIIPVIAIIEVLILIGVSTYAWFYARASKIIGSGTISVAADSGLDIDFQYSNVDDYINIWNYVSNDFTFEPGTSLDGRTIYFPTSGTFNNDTTDSIVFRDGTVNDINSKYLNIDFELTNTSDYPQYVYLNNNSYFHVQNVGSENYEESRALRLAFYQNDGNSGNVGSSLLNSGSSSDGGVITAPVSSDSYTIYFDNSTLNLGTPYAYFYDSDDNSSPEYHTAWPGVKMDRVSGKTYSVTIENPGTGGTKVKYDKLIISNNGNNQLATRTLTTSTKGHKFNGSGDAGSYTEHTIYFAKPYNWNKVYCHAWPPNANSDGSFTDWPGDEMTYVGSGIYAYSYDSANTGGFLFDNGSQYGTNQTIDISIPNGGNVNGKLYYCTGDTDTSGKYSVSVTNYSSLTYRTIYLFNTHGWDKPYATVSYGNTEVTKCDIALTSLSGNVYYCTVPDTIFTKVYFHAKEQVNDSYRTELVDIVDQRVYRPKDASEPKVYDNGHYYYGLSTFSYAKYIKKTGYPVISPGVSAGFQRPYSPVITIDAYSGAATEIIPAYSNSIDNYILGSGTPLFILEPDHMVSLSMIMWLEGTDEACTGASYAGKQIDLKLEFSTKYTDGNNQEQIVNPGDSNAYIYNFYDKTREIWTSDRQATESGVTVAPVMQLYDNTIKRGYLMSPSKYESYDGKRKVSCWTVSAPQSIALNGHDIIFRRVNPYNEDEVWNYWHAGPVAGTGSTVTDKSLKVYSVAQSTTVTTNDTISFTAFADGSPLKTMPGLSSDNDSTYKVPDESCGGLWGNHSVRTVTVYDGLRNQPLKDDNGVLTVNYSYPYKVSGTTQRTVKIEYKASGPELNSFYYVIMPEAAYANSTPCAFKRYTHFDSGFAINSAENNPNITFVGYYGKGAVVSGDYFELNELTSGNTDYSYWGSDMLYVQTNVDTKNYVYTSSSSSDSNAKLFQVFFTANTNFSNRSSNSRFVYLYYNGNLNPDGTGDGYACVVPNDRDYKKYRLENCSYNGTDQYNVSAGQSISSGTSLTFTDPYTGSNNSSNPMHIKYLGNNGITTTYIGVTIHLQTTHKSYNNDPRCHIYDNGGGSPDTWPGYLMKYETEVNNMSKYYVEDGTDSHNKAVLNVSKYNHVIFAYYGGSSQSAAYDFNMNTVHNDMVFESNGGNGNVGLVSSRSSSNNETLMTVSDWSPEGWPHLTFKE